METIGNAIRVADASALTEGDWRALRRESIGSSDASAVLGMGRYGSPHKVWQSKVQGREIEQSFAMTLGHMMEPVILDLAGGELSMTVVKPDLVLRHPDSKVLTCNLDGYATNPYGDEALIEAKHAGSYLKSQLTAWNETLVPPSGSAVEAWWVQLQHQLAITQVARGYLAALCDKDFFCIPVEYDQTFISTRIEVELPMWFGRHVAGGEEPDFAANDEDTVRSRFSSINADAEAVDMSELSMSVARISAIKADVKELKDEEKLHNVRLRAHLGDSNLGVIDGKKVISSFMTSRKSVDFSALKEQYPEAYDSLVTVKETRTYRT